MPGRVRSCTPLLTAALMLAVSVSTAALAISAPRPAGGSGPSDWELWYSVRARVRSSRADADLEAGGRLSMEGVRAPSGELELSLSEVLDHPWKLYWVDPLGPLGEEVKTAAVVTLSKASWAELEAARTASALAGTVQHRHWFELAERPRALDGSYAFIVVGAARNRFRATVGSDGSVTAIENRMTHQWLPGPFDQFIDTWGAEARTATAPEGYWFWNQGEERPFEYEPHTYHAFAAALELLAFPPPPRKAPEGSPQTIHYDEAIDTALGVLETLAPRVNLTSSRNSLPATPPLLVTRTNRPDGSLRISLTTPADSSGGRIEREAIVSPAGRWVGDRLRIEVALEGTGSLEIEVGYRQRNLAKESQ